MKALLYFLFFSGVYLIAFSQETTVLGESNAFASERRVEIPETNISIVPPAHFKKIHNENNFGFIHIGALASIQIKIVEGIPYTYIASSVTEENLKEQGVELILQKNVNTIYGKPAELFVLSYTVEHPEKELSVKFERLMLLTGTYQTTIWIDANYPVEVKDLLYNVMLASLLSIEF